MQHEMITKWARHKFNLPNDANIEVEQETRSHGYCETCRYEYEVWVVKDRETGKVLEEFRDDFASILREVLDYAAANMNEPPTVG